MTATAPPTPAPATEPGIEDVHAVPEPTSAALRRIARVNRRLMLLLVAAVVAIAVAASTLLLVDGTPAVSRSDEASTARWNEAAAQYEAFRQSRSNQAWAGRLDAAAEYYEAIRRTRGQQADAARLTQQAETAINDRQLHGQIEQPSAGSSVAPTTRPSITFRGLSHGLIARPL